MNKRKVQGKDKYLVQWKDFTAESNTWEGIENLENAKKLVEEFEKGYENKRRKIRRQESYEEKNIGEEFSLENSQQESYTDGMTRDMIGNIGIE